MDIQDLEVLQGKPMFCSRATRPSPAMSCPLIFQPPSLLSVCTSRKPSKTGTSPQLSPSSPAAPWPPAAQNNFPLLLPAGISYPMEIKLVKCRKPVPGPETTWLAGKQILFSQPNPSLHFSTSRTSFLPESSWGTPVHLSLFFHLWPLFQLLVFAW